MLQRKKEREDVGDDREEEEEEDYTRIRIVVPNRNEKGQTRIKKLGLEGVACMHARSSISYRTKTRGSPN